MELKPQNSRIIRGKLIGKGSYGVVNLGFSGVDVEKPFAVKSADKSNSASVEALDNEIEILKSISSSCVVKYYGVEEDLSSKSLLMEYMPGGDLARNGKVDDVELIRSYTWCIVAALREVHGMGIVHCDVKGSNVLLGGGVGSAKLADFGSARRVGVSGDLPRGSPLWMAPEVVRGVEQGFESDVWSVGCTVIEMFTGMPAWMDNGAHTLLKIGYSGDLPKYPAQLPELGRDFLDKCLVRDHVERWSCDQLLQHPFLVSPPAQKVFEASPRSILDWDNLDFSDQECEFHGLQNESDDHLYAKGRIGELATLVVVNWENDSWIEVRKENDEKTTLVEGVNLEFLNDNNPMWAKSTNEVTETEINSSENVNQFDNDEVVLEVTSVSHESIDSTWVNLSTEINEIEIEVDGKGGSICRQDVKAKKTKRLIFSEISLLSNLSSTLYSSMNNGRLPNFSMLFLTKLILIHCFRIIFATQVPFMLFHYSLNFELYFGYFITLISFIPSC